MATFRTKARAIELLGKNQIADLPTAITELWKNGYDAYGDNFHADLYCKGFKDVKEDIFCIKDDGIGMSYDDIIDKWIVLGTDSKKNKSNDLDTAKLLDKEPRITLGEKGIGRLSAAFLGDQMILVTKKPDNSPQVLFINWKLVENPIAFLEDLDIHVEECKNLAELNECYKGLLKKYKNNLTRACWNENVNVEALKNEILNQFERYNEIPNGIVSEVTDWFNHYQHGTVFIVLNPVEQIKSISKKNNDDSSSDTNYLYSTLSGLFNPFDARFEHFLDTKNDIGVKLNVHTNDDSRNILDSKEFFTIDDLDECEHWIKGDFDDFGMFTGKIKVDNEILDYTWKPEGRSEITDYKGFKLELGFLEGTKENSALSSEKYAYYNEKLDNYSGIFVYRDGFRVLPYGKLDADFLEFEYRRSKRAGTYYFSHRKMFGYIGISRLTNQNLHDKAGREGLTNNKAFKSFKEDLISFFVELAKKHYGTDSELKITRDSRKERQKQKKKEEEEERRNKRKIKEEEENQKKLLLEFRSKIKKQYMSLEKLHTDINNHVEQNHLLSRDSLINELELMRFFNDVNDFEMQSNKLRLSIDRTLPYINRDKDRINDYQQLHTKIVSEISEIQSFLLSKSSVASLIEKLKEVTNEYQHEIESLKTKNLVKIKQSYNELVDTTENWFDDYINLVDINTSSMNAKNTLMSDVQNDIELVKRSMAKLNENKVDIESRVDMYVAAATSEDLKDTINAYKIEYAKIEKTVNELHELAQLGISIELIDHQFNVQYSAIHRSMINLENNLKLAKNSDYRLLKNSFNHLEGNHKLLVPLYRSMNKRKKSISGSDILDVVNSFYKNVLETQKIDLIADKEFLEHSFSSYPSVIYPVVINIINNAIYWLRKGKEKIVRFMINERNEIIIVNSGKKMSFTELDECFNLFYSKKPNGRGMGMYLARTNLRNINKDIYATNNPQYNIYDGACFVICDYEKEQNYV